MIGQPVRTRTFRHPFHYVAALVGDGEGDLRVRIDPIELNDGGPKRRVGCGRTSTSNDAPAQARESLGQRRLPRSTADFLFSLGHLSAFNFSSCFTSTPRGRRARIDIDALVPFVVPANSTRFAETWLGMINYFLPVHPDR